MKLALAQVAHPRSFAEGLSEVLRRIEEAAAHGASLVCFPECALKGMRGTAFDVEALAQDEHDRALAEVREAAAAHRIHVVLPTERPRETGTQNGAYEVDARGEVKGYQTKNQIPIEEEHLFQPGMERSLFEIEDVPVGIVICHEGWRYPETVRWAAARGAKLVLHPSFGGGPGEKGEPASERTWGDTFWEKAMACRAGENHVWFASVNFAMPVQDHATCLVAPDGSCHAAAPLHTPSLLMTDFDPAAATGFLARRFAPDRYREAT